MRTQQSRISDKFQRDRGKPASPHEAGLRNLNELFQKILDASPSPIFIKDAESKFLFINRQNEKIFGKKREDVMGKRRNESFSEEMTKNVMVQDQEVMTTGNPKIFEDSFCLNGKEFTYLTSKFPLFNSFGKPYAICGIATDITERKRQEIALHSACEDLEKTVRERTESLASVNTELRSLSSELLSTQERERRLIATDLHDRIGQILWISNMKLELVRSSCTASVISKELDEIQNYIQEAIKETRSLIFEVCPPILHEVGLDAALQWLVEKIQAEHGINLEFTARVQLDQVSENTRILIFRSIHELLFNIVKHAKAQHAQLSITKNGSTIIVEIEDDGVGFDVTTLQLGKGFGIHSILKHLRHHGSSIEIDSMPSKGTRIVMRFALDASSTDTE